MVILSFITGLIGFRAVFFVLLLVWIPVEAWLLSSWGYTPGKWLTGTRIRDVTGGHLSFDKAMHRAFLVWFRGLGLGIPLVWLFTMPYAYFKLKYTGMTSWDRELRVTAYGEKVPLPRKIVAGLLLLFFFGFVTAAMYMLVIAMV